jgi:hypothetical protein
MVQFVTGVGEDNAIDLATVGARIWIDIDGEQRVRSRLLVGGYGRDVSDFFARRFSCKTGIGIKRRIGF